jgi:hypothetical protein
MMQKMKLMKEGVSSQGRCGQSFSRSASQKTVRYSYAHTAKRLSFPCIRDWTMHIGSKNGRANKIG